MTVNELQNFIKNTVLGVDGSLKSSEKGKTAYAALHSKPRIAYISEAYPEEYEEILKITSFLL
jgi:hypothetical protein